ncbi:MAG TPA: hypothetical protein VG323_14230, partial [Thermoanaerobaculia bacterium]|nr:hypothetical protein [Thermoanaerobaculia bacterium]
MRKLAIYALALLLATSAFGASFRAGSPSTTNNDDSCDISVQPAATLLLPYFEVDFRSPQSQARSTLFTVQNVSPLPQIAEVTLWTDYAYPGLQFPIFLTGYDVQSINLYDIFARAVVAPGPTPAGGGTSVRVTVPANPTKGTQPSSNLSNPNFLSDVSATCAAIPGTFPPTLLADIQQLFTVGVPVDNALGCAPPPQTFPPTASTPVGGTHINAIGYITIDVVATCQTVKPMSKDYFAKNLLYDNVLTGDYQIITRGDKNYAQGGPMVHIRAVPEGGPAGASTLTNLPYTFYDRYTTGFFFNRAVDRRQPLPSTFAPRYIQGGNGGFNTALRIWREGIVSGDGACSDFIRNSNMPVTEIVRFDEHENATVSTGCPTAVCAPPLGTQTTLSIDTSSQL